MLVVWEGSKINVTLGQYIFVSDEHDLSFPVRVRVLVNELPEELADIDELTGTIQKDEVEALRERLRKEYPGPRYEVASSWANTWKSVENNYRGLRDH